MNINKAIKPFWSWNDKLEKEELFSQIDSMNKSGIGGFFMHARGGLVTEYMSDEWFDCIKACIDKAEQLGMDAWAYDENGWPSGFANGIVPSKGEDFCQKHLVCRKFKREEEIPENLIACFLENDGRFTFCDSPTDNCIIIYYKVNLYYVDTFNREATACFIDNTHQKYYDKFSENFGKSLKGFFTDEPQYGKSSDIPWSGVFETEFNKRYGYSLRGNLPKLYFDIKDCESFRFDFYSMVSDLFVSSFLKPIYDWCEEHNCKLTGHLMMEDGVFSQIQATGGVMPCYEYFHEPGMDWLGKVISNSAVPKQLSSVAFQLGKKTVTEAFACVGWDISLNELKWIAQWHYVNGVTSLCPHLEGYSLRGCRKRDYPASLFIQLPWFEKAYREFSDYFSKLGDLLDSGEDFAPLLVIHPMHSGYIVNNPNNQKKICEMDSSLSEICRFLDSEHIPYHFGDETIIKRHGFVNENGLNIGKCCYKAVLLPRLFGLDSSTLRFLCDLEKSGGNIYCLGEFPEFVDGKPDNSKIKALSLKAFKTNDIVNLGNSLSKYSQVSVITNGQENRNIGCCQKTMPDGRMLYYIVNHSDEIQNIELTFKNICGLYEYDIKSEDENLLVCERKNGFTKTKVSLSPYGSIIIKSGEISENSVAVPIQKIALNPFFEVCKEVENAITLDSCEYRVDNGEWQDKTAVILIQDRLLKLKKSCDIELRFKFNISDIKDIENVNLCAETPNECEYQLNGKPFGFKDSGYFIDKSIRRCNIMKYIKEGINTLVIKRKFYQSDNVYKVLFTPNVHEVERNKLTFDTELESIYLIGNFSVVSEDEFTVSGKKSIFTGTKFSITSPKRRVDIRNLTTDGFWFFSGEILLSQEITVNKENDKRCVISFSKLFAPAMELYVNSQKVGLAGFAPFDFDVTDFVNNGKNTVLIKLFSGNRNLLGPHHRTYGNGCFVNPSTFTDKPEWGDDPENPTWTENYSFVVFGAET